MRSARCARSLGRRIAPSVLVLGVGNPLCGDDGLGPWLVRALAGARLPGCVVGCRNGDLIRILDDCAGFDALVCVDAAAPAGAPGRLHRFDLTTRALQRTMLPASSHGIGLAEVLALGSALDMLPRHVVVHAIEGGTFEHGRERDARVASGARRLTRRLRCELRRLVCHA